MDSTSLELSLNIRRTYVTKTITSLLNHLSKIEDVPEKLSELNDYIQRLEQEVCKMQGFKRELPHCMMLLRDAIEALKEEAMKMKKSLGMESEADDRHVMKEFLSLKRSADEQQSAILEKECRQEKRHCVMSSSGHLWNPNFDKKQKSPLQIKESATLSPFQPCKFSNGGGAFMPFKGCTGYPATMSMAAPNEKDKEAVEGPGLPLLPPAIGTPWVGPVFRGLNLMNGVNVGTVSMRNDHPLLNFQPKPLQQPIWRNNRRCWSPELHARFMNALQVLGGPDLATPKQIRELMQVDGLTNDQVKSHLQKYRLHNRQEDPETDDPAHQPDAFPQVWPPEDPYGGSWSWKLSTSQINSPQYPWNCSMDYWWRKHGR